MIAKILFQFDISLNTRTYTHRCAIVKNVEIDGQMREKTYFNLVIEKGAQTWCRFLENCRVPSPLTGQ